MCLTDGRHYFHINGIVFGLKKHGNFATTCKNLEEILLDETNGSQMGGLVAYESLDIILLIVTSRDRTRIMGGEVLVWDDGESSRDG